MANMTPRHLAVELGKIMAEERILAREVSTRVRLIDDRQLREPRLDEMRQRIKSLKAARIVADVAALHAERDRLIKELHGLKADLDAALALLALDSDDFTRRQINDAKATKARCAALAEKISDCEAKAAAVPFHIDAL